MDWGLESRIYAACAKGVGPWLAKEVAGLGLPVIEEQVAGVFTCGTLRDAMRMNLGLRTAQRVLFLLEEFQAWDVAGFSAGIRRLTWERVLAPDGYLCVTSSVDMPCITDGRFANVKCKDAIVDRIREVCGRRPDSGPERKGTVVFVYWHGGRVLVYVDTSGEPLSRRGYRKQAVQAPMQESLAAAVVLASGWAVGTPFVNPMCGSGTLAIEAALMSAGRLPGAQRGHFGFMHINGFRKEEWDEIKRRGRNGASVAQGEPGKIVATDIDPTAVATARANAERAGVAGAIEFGVCDFEDTPVPPGAGVVLMNPEYGVRMGEVAELEPLYGRIGDFFKKRCKGYMGFVFTGNLDLGKRVGLRTCMKRTFFNGELECKLLGFALYEGSKRAKKAGAGAGVDVADGVEAAGQGGGAP